MTTAYIIAGAVVVFLALVGALVWSARKRGESNADSKAIEEGIEAHKRMDETVDRKRGGNLSRALARLRNSSKRSS